ncbi:MAG TPA: CBS domain-containing protein, partial [Burkholderiaceae bacterium]|nr:CBS domain-containing protein [Burkholderiaceae bacterium]
MPRLTLSTLNASALQIPGADRWYANPEDPALSVMTDFRERSSVTVSETLSIDAALEHMKHTGVRCAFAVDEAQRLVVGLITAYDIMGEKPMRLMQATSTARSHLLVKDLMTRLPDL